MKKFALLVLSLLIALTTVVLAFADKAPTGQFDAKAGDVIYVCGCGEGCDCGTLAKKEGKCSCGKPLVKTTVTKVEKGKVFYTLNGKQLSAPTQGKYACGCGGGCNCGTIGQKQGKCSCNMLMVKVKK